MVDQNKGDQGKQPVPLPCKTPGCHSTLNRMPAHLARAVIEYQSQYRPGYQLRSLCEGCGQTSNYAYDEVMSLISPEQRPKPLQHDHFWAYILIEFKTSLSSEQRTYLSDRVLVQRLYAEPDKSWYGLLKSTSPYAPSLKNDSYVKGRPWGNYEICQFVVENGNPTIIERPPVIARTSSYAIFVNSKNADNGSEELLCAHISCSNPSCPCIYSTITYEKFKKLAAPASATQQYYDTGTMPVVTLHCEVCGTSRIIDERAFNGLFRGDLSRFKK